MKKTMLFLICLTIVMAAVVILFSDKQVSQVPTEDSDIKIDRIQFTEKLIVVPPICQYPALPTGCEAVAATMVLQYYDTNITAEEFAESWLACSEI